MYSTRVKNPQQTKVKITAGAVVLDTMGEILLEKRSDNGLWGLPGGGVLPGETIAATALREIREETGLDVDLIGFLGIYSDPQDGRIVCYPDNGDLVHIIDVIFIANIASGELRMSTESLELGFFRCDKLPKNIVMPALRPIHDFFSGKVCQIL